MNKRLFLSAAIAFAISATAIAANFPSYYPKNGFPNTGRVDAVYVDEGRIVIADMDYKISTSVVVHSLSSYRDSVGRIRKGAMVGFKVTGGDVIQEFWLLPNDYEPPRRRR